MKKWITRHWPIAAPATIVGAVLIFAAIVGASGTMDVASADHTGDDYAGAVNCEYTLTWRSDTYDVRIAINQSETSYRRHYVSVDEDGLAPDGRSPMGFTARFTEADASTLHNFYVRGYTPATADAGVQVCERHGIFRVKGGQL